MERVMNGNDKLPEGWEWKKLEEVAEVIAGNPAPQGDEYFSEGKHPFLRVYDMGRLGNDSHIYKTRDYVNDKAIRNLRLFPKDSVLFTKSGASTLLNQRAILGCDMYVVSHIAATIPNESILSGWLYYWLRTVDFNKLAHATTLPSLPLSKAKQIPIPLATLDQQKIIVAEIEKQFSRLDEAVAGLKRIKANIKRYKASVLKAAVEGKLTEEWRKVHPNVETGAELLKRILAERKKKWEEKNLGKKYKEPVAPDTSTLPELPEGWVWASIEMVADALGGNAFKSDDFVESGHQIVKMANIKMEKLDLSQRPSFIRNISDEVVDRYRIIDGDILVTLTGTRKKRDYGYVVCVRTPQHSLLLNQRIARLRPYLKNHSEYIAIVLQSEEYRNRFFSSETGNVGQGNVGMKAVTVEAIPIPPLLEQMAMITEYEKAISLANNTEQEIDVNLKRSERLRQSILKKAFACGLVIQRPSKTQGEFYYAIKIP